MSLMQHRATPYLIGFLAGLLASGFVYWTFFSVPSRGSVVALREDITNYRYIDPLLACNAPEATTGKYKELDDALKEVIATDIAQGKSDAVSLYFQEYPSGRWVGIDEDHAYDPASLLKIVLMIAYFKDEELHRGALKKQHLYSPSLDQINRSIPFASSSELTVGRSYTAEELIRAMIIDSDNGAKDVLLNDADDATLAQVYKDLKIPDPAEVAGAYTISPKQYSLFFRILYNSTYLPRTLSEKAMEILAEAKYPEGIPGGLPEGTTVAHKYGEHVDSVDGRPEAFQLHDCGVVYGPNLPYFLCVMTTGKKIADLQSTIQDVSRTVYAALDTNPHK